MFTTVRKSAMFSSHGKTSGSAVYMNRTREKYFQPQKVIFNETFFKEPNSTPSMPKFFLEAKSLNIGELAFKRVLAWPRKMNLNAGG